MAVTRTKPYREKSELTFRYTEPDDGGPYTIWLDAWFTRRKRFHCICNEKGDPIFRSRWISDVIGWLAIRDASEVKMISDGVEWVVNLRRSAIEERTTL